MIRIKNIFLTALLLLLCFACEEEQQLPILNKDYPVLITNEASDIDESGVTLSARITVPEGETISSFGFEILLGPELSRIDISGWKEISDFSYRLASNMVAGQEYEFKPFAISANRTVYGEPMTFTSQGQLGPEIIDFYPKQATVFDEITVIGRHFNLNRVILRLGDDPRSATSDGRSASLITGETDTVRFVPGTLALGYDNLSISITSDHITTTADQPLELIPPQVTAINARKGFAAESEFSVSLNNLSLEETPDLQIGFREANNPASDFEPAKILSIADNTITFKSQAKTGIGTKDLFIYPLENLEIAAGSIELASRWEKISDLPSNTEQDLVTVIDEKAYILSRNEFWRYDPTSNTWEGLNTYPGNNIFGAQVYFAIDNYIYYGLGFYNDLYRYNTTTGNWQRLNDTRILNSVNRLGAVVSGKYYEIGNEFGNRVRYAYDPATDTWSREGFSYPTDFRYLDLGAPRFVYNNRFYFVNGPNSAKTGGVNVYHVDFSNDEVRFNLENKFSSAPFEIDGVTSNDVGAIIGDQAIILIGLGTSTPRGVSIRYDLTTEEVLPLSPVITTELYHTFEINGELYGLRYYPGGEQMNELYKFKKEFD